MSAAYVIEALGRQAGLVVQIGKGRYRFFAALAEAAELEGREYGSVSDACRAARRALARSAA